jgi:hypothetical protein
MFTKKRKPTAVYIILAGIICLLSFFTVLKVYADTDGKELRTTKQPDKLILKLGTDFAGAEFELRLDSGVFPAPVRADKSGVLTMELGGSKTYTLAFIKSVIVTEPPKPKPAEPEPIPNPTLSDITKTAPDVQEERMDETDEIIIPEPETLETTETVEITESAADPEPPGNSIPLLHLILFLGGLILAVGGFIIIRGIKRRREYYGDDSEYEYDDGDE